MSWLAWVQTQLFELIIPIDRLRRSLLAEGLALSKSFRERLAHPASIRARTLVVRHGVTVTATRVIGRDIARMASQVT